ncbi:DUF3440 domain-containing protein [Priestia megaterium]|uniref:DUF3440 domain-containing protein n=1 Tax=Priestia megaterium TaxID=1404 RepID=UPI003F7FEAB0
MSKVYKAKQLNKDVLTLAKERIYKAFEIFDHVCVSFSGGKDSTVCLMLTYEIAKELGRLPLDVVFYDEEAIPYETEEYARRVSQMEGISFRWFCLPVVHRNACSRKQPYWNPWNPKEEDKWVRPLPPEAITYKDIPNYKVLPIPQLNGMLFPPSEYGTTGLVMGIRAQESLSRRRAVSMKIKENYISPSTGETDKGNVWKVYPIYDWYTEDVWTAPKKFGWDYNKAYDVMEKAGIKHNQQRCAPPYGEEPLGGLYLFKTCFPDIWDKMSERVPGANTASMYARTELYSFGKKAVRPEGMTWEEAINYYIKKFDESSQKLIAKRIQDEIKLHYKKTKDPILDSTPHYDTGLSWDFLLMLAQRGDFKGRRSPLHKVDYENRHKAKEKYYKALEEKLKEDPNYAKRNR